MLSLIWFAAPICQSAQYIGKVQSRLAVYDPAHSLVHHFINTPTYILRSGGRRQQGALVELSEKFLQVLACELPIERLRLGFPVVLKIE